MKAKELAEKLLEYPEFEVHIIFCDNNAELPYYRFFEVSGMGDIGYSDKIIQLDIEEK